MKNTVAKKDENVIVGTIELTRRIGHLKQRSSKFKSKKQYNRKESKRVEE